MSQVVFDEIIVDNISFPVYPDLYIDGPFAFICNYIMLPLNYPETEFKRQLQSLNQTVPDMLFIINQISTIVIVIQPDEIIIQSLYNYSYRLDSYLNTQERILFKGLIMKMLKILLRQYMKEGLISDDSITVNLKAALTDNNNRNEALIKYYSSFGFVESGDDNDGTRMQIQLKDLL